MRKIGKSLLALSLLLLIGILAACGPSTGHESREEIVLGAARNLAPGPADAFYCSSILQVWEPLIGVDEHGEPYPVLATSWEHSDDAKVWTFHLRQGVHFHDGTPFNAQTVLRNLDRIAMGFRKSIFYYMSLELMYPSLEKWEAPDPYTVRLTFGHAMPTLPYLMGNWNSAQFNPKSWDPQTGDFINMDIGTGPFRLTEVVRDQYVRIERNEHYWGQKAKTAKFRIKVIPEAETRFSALQTEEIMGVVDLGAITPVLAGELAKQKQFEVVSSKSTISHYLAIRGENSLLGDPRMKKAISLAVDRESMAKNYFRGHAKPTRNLINSVSPFGKVVAPEHNPQLAVQLAKEVLGDRRIPAKLVISQASTARYPYKEMAEWIQAMLRPLGIDVTIELLDGAAATQTVRDGKYDLILHIRGLSSMDPEDLYWEWMSTSARGTANVGRHVGYTNPEAQRELVALATTQTLAERKAAYDRLASVALQDPPLLPLFEDENLLVHNRKIKGFRPNIYGVTLAETEWAE